MTKKIISKIIHRSVAKTTSDRRLGKFLNEVINADFTFMADFFIVNKVYDEVYNEFHG